MASIYRFVGSRRSIALSLALLIAGSPGAAADRQMAQGTVFHDANGNGTRDSSEIGLAGVAVSNGHDVVVTDSDGAYSLDVDDDTGIFVIKPSGYALPVNQLQIPQFYYLHKPLGSPPARYKGVAPSGPLPSRIDFPLLTTAGSEVFKVAVFADPQVGGAGALRFMGTEVVSELVGRRDLRFGITVGDIVGDKLDMFTPVASSIARIGIPWFNIPGNHDLNYDATSPELSDESYEGVFGPSTYAFNEGKVHFIMLNNVVYPLRKGPPPGGMTGGLAESQLKFVENSLRHVPRDHLVVLVMHMPLHLVFGRSDMRNADRERLFALLTDRPNTLSLSGHSHTQSRWDLDASAGWHGSEPHHHYNVGTVSGDWWRGELDARGIPDATMADGTPNGYAILSFSGTSYDIDYKVAGKPASHRMSVYAPRVVRRGAAGGQFYVNYFQGYAQSVVEYREHGKPWVAMRPVLEIDPTMAAIRYRWDTATALPLGRRPGPPRGSFHLWRADLPTQRAPGRNTIEIRAMDSGKISFGSFTYDIIDRSAEKKPGQAEDDEADDYVDPDT